MVLAIFSQSSGKFYCLPFSIHLGLGICNREWAACPLSSALTTHLQAEFTAIVFSHQTCRASVPRMYSCMGDAFTTYSQGGSCLLPKGKLSGFISIKCSPQQSMPAGIQETAWVAMQPCTFILCINRCQHTLKIGG